MVVVMVYVTNILITNYCFGYEILSWINEKKNKNTCASDASSYSLRFAIKLHMHENKYKIPIDLLHCIRSGNCTVSVCTTQDHQRNRESKITLGWEGKNKLPNEKKNILV
jgi:hypothetical protein